MTELEYFKNFNIGTEIDLAGSFAYAALGALNSTEDVYLNDQIFLFLYNAAVSIERMQKCVLFMYGGYNESEINSFAEDLKSHDHLMLQGKICEYTRKKLPQEQNSFLILLRDFYSDGRYGNFSSPRTYNCMQALVDFVRQNYDSEMVKQHFITKKDWITESAKERIGRTLGKILSTYYELIRKQAHKLGIFTYELRHNSPAEKVFYNNYTKKSLQAVHAYERNALAELLVFMINTKESTGFFNFIRKIAPLPMDPYMVHSYLTEIMHKQIPQDLIDEVDSLYEKMHHKEITDRKECLAIFETKNVSFPEDDEFLDCMDEYDEAMDDDFS